MPYPLNLILIRHGESEGNIANTRSRQGDHHDFTPEHLARFSYWWRLTDNGINQAKNTGHWLRQESLTNFDHYLSSPYLRAIETAAHLQLPDALWECDYIWRERAYGLFDAIANNQKQLRYPEIITKIKQDPFFTPFPEGESIEQLCTRLQNPVTELLGNTYDGKNVIIITHGDTIRGIRTIIEGIDPRTYKRNKAENQYLNTWNCQVIHYTRVNPVNPADKRQYPTWVRSKCPTRENSPIDFDWHIFKKPTLTNKEILELVNQTSRLIN